MDITERKVGGLTVRIDRLLCVGFGDCIELAPDAFAFDEDGIAAFLPTIDRTDRERLLRACEVCPVDAISLLDEHGNTLAP
jgi:ferredoxin